MLRPQGAQQTRSSGAELREGRPYAELKEDRCYSDRPLARNSSANGKTRTLSFTEIASDCLTAFNAFCASFARYQNNLINKSSADQNTELHLDCMCRCSQELFAIT